MVSTEKSVPADAKSLETAVLGLNANTCCVCADELANWSEILGELLVLIPPVLATAEVMELEAPDITVEPTHEPPDAVLLPVACIEVPDVVPAVVPLTLLVAV